MPSPRRTRRRARPPISFRLFLLLSFRSLVLCHLVTLVSFVTGTNPGAPSPFPFPSPSPSHAAVTLASHPHTTGHPIASPTQLTFSTLCSPSSTRASCASATSLVSSSINNLTNGQDQSKSRRSLPSLSQPYSLPLSSPSDSSEEKIYIAGLEGKRSVLPCNVTRPLNDTIDLILWFRGADEKALYSIDARRAPTMQRAKHFSGDELGARAYIDLSTRPTGLIIESVKAEDAGEYKCRIDFRKSRSEYRAVHLDVYVPPKELIIMDEFGQRLSDPVGPFNEGSHLNLICEAEGGNPRPILHWYKNNRLIDDTWSVTAQGIVRNELILSRLERADQGSMLTCQVLLNVSSPGANADSMRTASSALANGIDNQHSSLHVLKSVFSLITLELNLRPLDVRITTVHRPVIAGQMVMINCESSGSKPPALLSWWRGAQRLEGAIEEVANDENRTVSTLQFVPAIDDNNRVLSCRADHSVLPDSALEDSWILNVLFTPQLTISFGAAIQHDQIREGSNVSFECHVAGNPSVGEIGWMFENRLLTLGLNDFSSHHNLAASNVLVKENSLMIHNVNRQHSGRYRCVAANAQGEGRSEDILLKVQYAPVCKQEQRVLYGVAKREPIEVPCTVESDPTEVTFRWMFNSSHNLVPMKNYKQPSSTNPMTSVATYTPLNKHGYGQLLCWASNELGEQSEPCVFNVIPAAQPQPLRNCVVRNQSTDGLVVNCDPGDDGGLEQQFFLEVFQAEQGQLWGNFTLTELPVEFVVTNVPVSTTFVLVLYAANAKGRSNYVTLSANTMPPGSRGSEFLKFTADIGIKPLMYILAIVVTGLVVAAIAIVTISRARTINRSKGRHEPLPASHSKGKLSTASSNAGSHPNGLDTLGTDPTAMQMFELGASMPGPSGLATGCLDLYDNQEIMTNSSSLYDDSSNLPMNSHYGKAFNPSLLADGTTATPTSPSTHSSQQQMIIKNPMAHMETTSMDSGPPPLYHSVYNNFATWNHGKPSMEGMQMAQPEDLLLMDVSTYYSGGTDSPSSALLGMSAAPTAWNGAASSISVPFHHHLHHQQQQFAPSELFTSSATVLMATPHPVSSTPTGGMPYLNGNVSIVDPNSSQARFYSQSPVNTGETIIFETGQPQAATGTPGVTFSDSLVNKSPLKQDESKQRINNADTILSTPV